MKIKDFFYFSKSQRVGIVVLLSLILLTLLGGILMPYIFPKKEMVVDEQFMDEARNFKNTLKDKEPTWTNYDNYSHYTKYDKKYNKSENSHYKLFTFDPNEIDSADFVKLGLKPYIAKNILKYRNKGGRFKTAESFAKVYGISSEKFKELKPYIKISEVKNSEATDKITETETAKNETSYSAKKQNIVLELNSADTAELKLIRGIGTSFAKRIVGYRNILGGYVSLAQLKEVYGMKPEMYEQIRNSFTVNPSLIRKIDINTASFERLKSHPYIKSFEKAKAIYEFRRNKGKLKNINDLKVLDELNEDDLKKLEPYLEFK